MNTRGILLYLLLFLFPISLQAKSLNESLLEALAANDGVRHESARVEQIFLTYLRLADPDRVSLSAGVHRKLFTKRRTNHSLHRFGAFPTFYLELPLPGESTVWQILTDTEKTDLVEMLALSLQMGDSSGLSHSDDSLEHDLAQTAAAQTNLGLSPRLIIDEANAVLFVGDDRITHLALIGALAEMGWPKEDLRLTWTDDEFHYGLRYRTSGKSAWKDVVASPSMPAQTSVRSPGCLRQIASSVFLIPVVD